MSTPPGRAAATATTAAAGGRGRPVGRRPGGRLMAVTAGVMALHVLLIAQWTPGAWRLGSGPGAAPRPMLLVPRVPGWQAAGAGETAVPLGAPPAAAPPVAPHTAPDIAPNAPPPVLPRQLAPPKPAADDAPAPLPGADARSGEALPPPVLPLRPSAAASQAALEVDADAEAGAPPPPADGAPPPVYPTRIPLPMQASYRLASHPPGGGAPTQGQARLALRHDGQRYTLQLDGRADGRPVIEQLSTGGFDAAGFAPERFTDRRRGRGWRAANFRRDTGRIGFSGPRIDYPLLPGTQDRLSAVAQLVAIVAAAPDTAATGGVQVFVADARGWAETWHWQSDGADTVDTPLGSRTLQHWRREPPRPEGLRVEAWLDPARGHWPARLRYTLLRSGQVLDLVLDGEPLALRDAPLQSR